MGTFFRRRNIISLIIITISVISLMAIKSTVNAITNQIEPKAGSWKTWVLTSGSQFRLATPPDKTATAGEITQLKALVGKRDAAALDMITYWDAGGPSYRWNAIASAEVLKN